VKRGTVRNLRHFTVAGTDGECARELTSFRFESSGEQGVTSKTAGRTDQAMIK
jgi:hypothetical protein